MFINDSKSRRFYAHLLNCEANDNLSYRNTLIHRVKKSLQGNASLFTVIFNHANIKIV